MSKGSFYSIFMPLKVVAILALIIIAPAALGFILFMIPIAGPILLACWLIDSDKKS